MDESLESRLWPGIRAAVLEGRYDSSRHADERCIERGIVDWQVEAGIEEAVWIDQDVSAVPHPKVRVRQLLPDGQEIEAVWSWDEEAGGVATLVTVYFPHRR